MSLQELLEKMANGSLPPEEQGQLMEEFITELQTLKEQNPKKYSNALREFSNILRDLQTDLDKS